MPSAMMHNQNTVICAGKKPRWLRIGVAFRGVGLTVVLNALQFRRENFLLEPQGGMPDFESDTSGPLR